MKYSPRAEASVKPVSEPRIQSVLWVLCFLAMLVHPSVMSASAGITQDNGDLYLSCRADNDCVLSSTPIGEEQVSDQTFATLVQPEVITFEFLMDPAQDHIALVQRFWKNWKLTSNTKPRQAVSFVPPWNFASWSVAA